MTLYALHIALLVFSIQITAFEEFVTKLPNGNHFHAVGHIPKSYTKFSCIGQKYDDNPDWSSYCHLDCDEDGLTNGEELGDSCCEWKSSKDDSKLRKTDISDPNDPTDMTTAPKCKKTTSKTPPSARTQGTNTKSLTADEVVAEQDKETGSNGKVVSSKSQKVTKEKESEIEEGTNAKGSASEVTKAKGSAREEVINEKGSASEKVTKEKGSKVVDVTKKKVQDEGNVTNATTPISSTTEETGATELLEEAGGSGDGSMYGESGGSETNRSESGILNSALRKGGYESFYAFGGLLAIWISLLL
uniref:AlNc14C340G10787 protein n=1 Tax=Albugo laibachii Nc14 TaxID=890382 RepID=F0WX30_9STRA|nr:AlNc14C340G10787 [Albugo laibachii Nc14]|eukprot:CCA26019.1 AlNc14C340G10787 [Albugo laibachii Nc14]